MKFLRRVFLLLLISTLALESEAWFDMPISTRPHPTGCKLQPPSPERTRVSPCNNYNTCYDFKCNPGCVRVSGDTRRVCIKTSHGEVWSGYDLICEGSCCSEPPSLTGTYISRCKYPYTEGAVATYSCNYWHTQVSGSTTKTCSKGVWTGEDLVCKLKDEPKPVCPTPPSPAANTTMKACTATSNFTNGDFCRYECSPGYVRLSGSNYRTCSNGVSWTGTDLVCVRGCPPPQTDHSVWTHCEQPLKVGARCAFCCPPLYLEVRVKGSRSVTTCSNNGTWTTKPIGCERASAKMEFATEKNKESAMKFCIFLLDGGGVWVS
ncbi:P-selectin-like [Branchiostoma floridae x Branchiostoma japonicum]